MPAPTHPEPSLAARPRVQRGDVVLVAFPFAAGGMVKVRPALVVQNDEDNRRLANTIVAMITGQTKRALQPTQLFINLATADGALSGLQKSSVVNCAHLVTVEQTRIRHALGRLPGSLMEQVGGCLKAALALL
jgi:mRNA interferase MazF